ncbi:IS66 family insertion sequence element accessory protein TnpB [Rhizosaccharibacter radicis]|uniref:IS66 family insertion sequence element accessory protein TnpB n=1 Tax=Rhizosaccharibacter radicis TaxID=2782605 RepID=UPI003BF5D714
MRSRDGAGRDHLTGRNLHPCGRRCRAGGPAARHDRSPPVIVPPTGVRVWLANGHTDMRRGMNGLALQVQETLQRDPHAGDLYVFRGRRGDLVKILWHDGLGMSLYAKRLERGRFLWPSPADGCVAISASQLGYMLDGIDWRNPQRT